VPSNQGSRRARCQWNDNTAWQVLEERYDAAGSMTLAPRPGDESDANDALICVYDAWNRLVAVHDDDGEIDTNVLPAGRKGLAEPPA